MTMGKIRRAIAEFTRSRRPDDKRHPRFLAGYLAGMRDAKLEAETTHEDGIVRLEKWSEEHVLWYHGRIVWRSSAERSDCGGSEIRSAFGLEAQGHIPAVEAALAESADWQEIGRRIGWDGNTAKEYYERHLARLATTEGAADGR